MHMLTIIVYVKLDNPHLSTTTPPPHFTLTIPPDPHSPIQCYQTNAGVLFVIDINPVGKQG